MTPDRAECYQAQLGTAFLVVGTMLHLTLEVVDTFETLATEGFSLRFTGPVQPTFAQGMRALEHPTLGSLELFLVPVLDPRAEVRVYEAIFNRLKPRTTAKGDH